jgi:catechol 2,3-dioxygenase-like lactoylglutathione lyase family enzyme
MIDHMGIAVADIVRSRAFYEAALGALGMVVGMEIKPEPGKGGSSVAFGKPSEKIFWISDGKRPGEGLHVAFEADTRAQVDAFHAAGLKAGGRDNGAPGPRPHYGSNYYAAFLFDPDGANIEAVCYSDQ